jgi:hypothetical protein
LGSEVIIATQFIIAAPAADKGGFMADLHTELYPALADVIAKVEAADAELAFQLAHFAANVSPKLTEAERTQLSDLLDKVADLQAWIISADPRKHAMHLSASTPPAGGPAPASQAASTTPTSEAENPTPQPGL